MQRTERTTVVHHRSDLIYHVRRGSRADWREVRRDGQEEWGETDKKSEARRTRRVRRDGQEEWGETDKTMAEEFQNQM